MTHSRFESLGVYLPEKRVTTDELIQRMNFIPPFSLENITGIKERRVRGENEDSYSIALAAARNCLNRSRYQASEIDIVINASICRIKDGKNHYWEPSFALLLSRELGIHNAIHFDISNACAGMMTGVQILDRMIKAGIVKNGLVISGECITPITDTAVLEISDPFDSQFASLTVGDAGAAVIVDRSIDEHDRIHYIELMTCAEYSHLCIGKPSDKLGSPALYTNNQEMHKEERVQLWPRLQMDYFAKHGKTFAGEQYDYVIHHQVGTRAMRNFSKFGSAIFESPVPESLSCVETLANTATTSHFLVLHQHIETIRGKKTLLVPAASGVVTGFVSATISSLEV